MAVKSSRSRIVWYLWLDLFSVFISAFTFSTTSDFSFAFSRIDNPNKMDFTLVYIDA